MDAREYLEQALVISARIKDLRDQLAVVNQKMLYVSPRLDNDVSSSGQVGDKLPKQIAKQEHLISQIIELEIQLVEVKATLTKFIVIGDAEINELLIMKYVMLKSNDFIAKHLDRTIKWVYENHTKGVALIQRKLNRKAWGNTKYLLFDNVDNVEIMFDVAEKIMMFLEINLNTFNSMYHQRIQVDKYIVCDSLDDLRHFDKN